MYINMSPVSFKLSDAFHPWDPSKFRETMDKQDLVGFNHNVESAQQPLSPDWTNDVSIDSGKTGLKYLQFRTLNWALCQATSFKPTNTSLSIRNDTFRSALILLSTLKACFFTTEQLASSYGSELAHGQGQHLRYRDTALTPWRHSSIEVGRRRRRQEGKIAQGSS